MNRRYGVACGVPARVVLLLMVRSVNAGGAVDHSVTEYFIPVHTAPAATL